MIKDKFDIVVYAGEIRDDFTLLITDFFFISAEYKIEITRYD